MPRLRFNGLRSSLGAPMTASATTITFSTALSHSDGQPVPTIPSGSYIALSILSAETLREIVYLTSYTQGETSGTVLRAQEGTTSSAYNGSLKVINAPTALDAVTRAELDAAYVAYGATDPSFSLPAGQEYVWFKTDGSGILLDIVSGVA